MKIQLIKKIIHANRRKKKRQDKAARQTNITDTNKETHAPTYTCIHKYTYTHIHTHTTAVTAEKSSRGRIQRGYRHILA